MKFFALSDNIDTAAGMRMAGIESEVLHTSEEVAASLKRLMSDSDIGIVMVTEKLLNTCPDMIYAYKLTQKRPLIVEIPDRHGHGDVSELISQYISQAIGMKL